MNVEFSVSSAAAKTRAIDRLRAEGLAAVSGSVRLAYPFSIAVDVSESELTDATRLVNDVDPCAGVIVTSDLTRAAQRPDASAGGTVVSVSRVRR